MTEWPFDRSRSAYVLPITPRPTYPRFAHRSSLWIISGAPACRRFPRRSLAGIYRAGWRKAGNPGHPRRKAPSLAASSALTLSDWFERWFPDAFALVLAAAATIAAASILAGSSVIETAQRFGAGSGTLGTFTLQMSMIIVTG